MVDIIQNLIPGCFVDEFAHSLVDVLIHRLDDCRLREHLKNQLGGLYEHPVFMEQLDHIPNKDALDD
jgi:hypothetical protein